MGVGWGGLFGNGGVWGSELRTNSLKLGPKTDKDVHGKGWGGLIGLAPPPPPPPAAEGGGGTGHAQRAMVVTQYGGEWLSETIPLIHAGSNHLSMK